ncbi:TIR domain-containing protein [Paraburkholderia sp. 40]|uniref:TIR domain-containing protein n=1 Tax=Paraburkholderia sp. 40 TaxID=2991059 RepID=UPI003D1B500D
MSETPRVFVASSAEALPVAEAVNIRLEHDAKVKQWDNAFELSSLTLPSLLERAKNTDFAVFVFHKDDKTIIRGNTYSAVRDNVLFELGLFIGSLGIDRCFVLVPKSVEGDFRLPTDLAGLTVASYDDTVEDMVDAVATSCAKIKQAVRKIQASTSQAPVPTTAETASASATELKTVQSELWRTRLDLQRSVEQQARMQEGIATHFFSIAKPATEKEIANWEEGAKGSYSDVPKLSQRNTFFVDRDVIVPALYGAHSISVIVADGVKVFGLGEWSHNSIYFMDGFRKLGS